MLWKIVEAHVKMRAPTKQRLKHWWDSKCKRAYKHKLQAFKTRHEFPARYKNASRRCKRVQRRAFATYNLRLKTNLSEMEKSDRKFWDLTKQIARLQANRSKSAPSAEALAQHFAEKMSSGAEVHDNDWVPPEKWTGRSKISSFKFSCKTVLKALQSADTSKSMNGIPNIMLKEYAQDLHKPLTLLFRHICSTGVFPERWKIGRITALHKRGPISVPKQY